MKIVLSTSPHIKHSAVLESDFQPRNDLMYTFAPLGLLMLCSTLRSKIGITPVLYDINSKINKDEIRNSKSFYYNAAQSILSLSPDVMGFMTECDSYHHVLQICKEAKRLKPDCYIVLGGPHATAVAKVTMDRWNCVDCIVLGEGEVTFCEVIESLQLKDRKIVPGTIMRVRQEVVEGPKRILVDSLDNLPFPAYDLYKPLPGEELFVEAGRGCPFKCTFCSTAPFWQRKHRVKAPSRIIAELEYINTLHEVKRVHFTHDLFTANQKWVEEVCSAIIEANLDVKWTCSSRIDTVSEALIELMSAAGCNAIFFGIESGSERILRLINKEIPLSDTKHVISLCRKYNISPNGGLILGFPFEDQLSFTDTFNAYGQLLELGIKPLHVFSYCPFAQSDLYQSLGELECSGHFLDIPLPHELDIANRELIRNDRDLFGSYFRPNLELAIDGLQSEVLSAIDEFALLVDAVRIPSMYLASLVGGFDKLFFDWVEYISIYNKDHNKREYRKYFGGPLDYCEFIIGLCDGNWEVPLYIKQFPFVIRQNFKISLSLSHIEATTMANYRSKTLPKDLFEVSTSRLSADSIVASMHIDYDAIPLLNSNCLPQDFLPEKTPVNLLWQMNTSGEVSLLRVNDFIFSIATQQIHKPYTTQELIDNWVRVKGDTNVDYAQLFEDLRVAIDIEVLTVN